MTAYRRLPRTEGPPVELAGTMLVDAMKSPMSLRVPVGRYKYVRWFEVDVYCSEGGTYAAAVRYRFRGALPNERQYDDVLLAPSWGKLVEALWAYPASKCVNGFPEGDNWDRLQSQLMGNVVEDWCLLVDDVEVALQNQLGDAVVVA